MAEQPGFYSPEIQRVVEQRVRDEASRQQSEREIDAQYAAIASVREDIEGKIREYQEKCGSLQTTLRRTVQAETRAHYSVFLTMQLRMAGAMTQAIQRAKSMDRVVVASKARQEEDRAREAQDLAKREQRKAQDRTEQLLLPQSDDLEFLYGQEGGLNAP